MTDDELREMVRASIEKIAGVARPDVAHSGGPAAPEVVHAGGPSFARMPLLRGSDTDGACLIEPAVRCTHCGYCLSYGH
jgi:hypothetical protein